jgi:hypothetical protein
MLQLSSIYEIVESHFGNHGLHYIYCEFQYIVKLK